MGNFEWLSSELQMDILSRLEVKDIVRLKSVSKTWRDLLSDRQLIQAQSQIKQSLSGFFFQQRFEWCLEDLKTITFTPIQREGANFCISIFDFLPQDVVILSSCNGLICCRSCFPYDDPAIYVCNPVNKEWIKLDWYSPEKESDIGLAFDPSHALYKDSANFKVVRVRQFMAQSEELCFKFDIYSSRTRSWCISEEICWCQDTLKKNGGVFISGVLHWLTQGGEVLTFNVENQLAWLISAPVPATEFKVIPEICIGESKGRLHYVMISEEGLQVWSLEDYFESNWSIKHSKTLAELEMKDPKSFFKLAERVEQQGDMIDFPPWVDPIAFKDKFLLMRVSSKIYRYNIETSNTEEVCSISEFGAQEMFSLIVCPYSFSMVPLRPELDGGESKTLHMDDCSG